MNKKKRICLTLGKKNKRRICVVPWLFIVVALLIAGLVLALSVYPFVFLPSYPDVLSWHTSAGNFMIKDVDEFHVLRITQKNENVSFYADGVFLGKGKAEQRPFENNLVDFGSRLGALTAWDYFYYSTVGAFGAGNATENVNWTDRLECDEIPSKENHTPYWRCWGVRVGETGLKRLGYGTEWTENGVLYMDAKEHFNSFYRCYWHSNGSVGVTVEARVKLLTDYPRSAGISFCVAPNCIVDTKLLLVHAKGGG